MNAEKVVILVDRKQNLVEIKNQRQIIPEEIKQVRNKINGHLDGLKQPIHHDVYAAEEKVKTQIEDLLRKLADHTENIDILQTNMSAIKEYASDLQAFIGSKLIEKELKKQEIFMQSLIENDSLQKKDLNCKIKDKISDVLSTVTSIGSISVTSNSPFVVLQTDKNKQAQIRIFHRETPTPINDIKMTLNRKFELIGTTGGSFSSTGDVFLVDNSKKRLLILKKYGTLKIDIP
ncbi:Hypothetical predicted protein [Mytilus galloprovincialis]|uniref:Uncharacterized protein n=1 Tax=Mytilus galloprovincialis TaxID=29158 RepID=A0A8B6FAN3_MYTGA|nr:Hypothetical predicted protein [Mytilus galloprovincialis]